MSTQTIFLTLYRYEVKIMVGTHDGIFHLYGLSTKEVTV
jgi:hypothetical protein